MPSSPVTSETGDPLLLTPGPLTTSKSVKEVMVHDWGSRDQTFITINREVREQILDVAGASETHVCVTMQGSGTFAVEAMLTSFVPKDGKILILINGAYGTRAAKICKIAGRAVTTYETAEDIPPNVAEIKKILEDDTKITHVFAVHCETTGGILNPIKEIADVVKAASRRLLVDSMSAFGALEIDAKDVYYDALAASSNKCLESIPGMGFVVCRETALAETEGNATTLTLDLFDQHKVMEATNQWRFTPPIHVIVSLHKAIEEYLEEGGQKGRGARYANNRDVLIKGMREMGFKTLLPDPLQAPIIITFHMPGDPKFDFQTFYDKLHQKGFIIYPGKLTVADSFRIGCIGRLYEKHMLAALNAVRETMAELGVANGTPAIAAE